jgi:hypothetical protein
VRHAVKLALLIPSLAFLLWWGWSGNFAFDRSSLFSLEDQESFYTLELGQTPMGHARRDVKTEPETGRTTVSEESVLDLNFSGGPFRVRTSSQTVFGRDGKLSSAVFTLPLGDLEGQASAEVEGGFINCRLTLAGQIREARAPLPQAGPILVSGLIPWLSRQRDVPVGRVIGLSILDPVSMAFKPAELIVEDATTISEELTVYKLTLKFMGAENLEWVDSRGLVLRQFNPGLEIGLSLIRPEDSENARQELLKASEEGPRPLEGPMAAIVGGLLAADGLDLLSEAIGLGGDFPWVKIKPGLERPADGQAPEGQSPDAQAPAAGPEPAS